MYSSLHSRIFVSHRFMFPYSSNLCFLEKLCFTFSKSHSQSGIFFIYLLYRMKTHTAFTRFVLSATGILLALLLVSPDMYAQTGIDPPAGGHSTACGMSYTVPGWTGPATVNIPLGGGCYEVVTYYHRIVQCWPIMGSETEQSVVTNIGPPTGTCTGITDQQIFDAIPNNNTSFATPSGLPPCGQGYTPRKMELRLPSCWALAQVSPREFTPCGSSTAYCLETCDMCYNLGIYTWNCTFSIEGTPSCSPGTYVNVGDCLEPLCGTSH